jgi:hypothetical protein
MGDSAYGSAEMLGWLVYEHGIVAKGLAWPGSILRRRSSHPTFLHTLWERIIRSSGGPVAAIGLQ